MTHHNLMHGKNWSGERVGGWLCQEKFNGVRCYFDGSALFSRNGERFNAPDWFTAGLPDAPLDGELYAGVGTEGRISNRLARWKSGADVDWQGVTFCAFDAPDVQVGFQARTKTVARRVQDARHAFAVKTWQVESLAKLRCALKALHAEGREGLMLRHPDATYTAGRTSTVLKFKSRSLY